jgi:uncharacterized protein YceH (UPF0502 family)
MIQLNPTEARVLGVLVEKAQTTPGQYPLTLNSMVTGSNQRSNRYPVTNLSEEEVLEAIDTLKAKDLMREVVMSGSRVPKFRHVARETLSVSTSELVVLTELLLRGAQTVGEIRGRASRMHPLESLEIVENVLASLRDREQPLVKELAPEPGSRARKWTQTMCPALQALGSAPATEAEGRAAHAAVSSAADDALAARVEALERDVAALKREMQMLRQHDTTTTAAD